MFGSLCAHFCFFSKLCCVYGNDYLRYSKMVGRQIVLAFEQSWIQRACGWRCVRVADGMLLTFTKEFSKSRLEINLVSTKPNYEPVVTQPRDNDN